MTTIEHNKTSYGFRVSGTAYLVEFSRFGATERWAVSCYLDRGAGTQNPLIPGTVFTLARGHKPTKQKALDFLKLALFGDRRHA